MLTTNGESLAHYSLRGITLELPSSLLTSNPKAALEQGYYEGREADELVELIGDGERILDIGSGIGFIAALAKKDTRTGAVFAVEAYPNLIPILRRTFEINEVEVMIFNEILGKEAGESLFFINENFLISSKSGFYGGRRVVVPITEFQHRLNEVKPTMLIVDIEGGELDLFEGVNLRGVNKIMIEVHQQVIGRQGILRLFNTLASQEFHYDQWHSSRNVVTFSHVDRS
jgi:FkbM family methyltransferase